MKKLLLDIQARLIAQVPALKYVDEDSGQFDDYGDWPPVQMPACVIDANTGNWSNIGNRAQMGLISVTIRIMDLKITNTSGNAPQGQKTAAFAIYDTYEAVYIALQGWTGDMSYSGLIRTNDAKRQNQGQRIKVITFTTELKDVSAKIIKPTIPRDQVTIKVVSTMMDL